MCERKIWLYVRLCFYLPRFRSLRKQAELIKETKAQHTKTKAKDVCESKNTYILEKNSIQW